MEANYTFYKRDSNTVKIQRLNDWASSLLFVRCGDKEGVDSGVLVMSDLDDELWDSQPDVVEEP